MGNKDNLPMFQKIVMFLLTNSDVNKLCQGVTIFPWKHKLLPYISTISHNIIRKILMDAHAS